MIIGITGSRKFPNKQIVRDFIESLPFGTIIRHGGCRNSPDAWADFHAKRCGLKTQPMPADWSNLNHPDARIKTRWDGTKYDANAGLRRNGDVTAAPDVDEVVGFWDGASKGTKDALDKAKKAGKPTSWYDTEGVRRPW